MKNFSPYSFKNTFLMILLLFALTKVNANSNRDTLRVLFVGNSYIYYNNLPQMVSLISDSLNTKLICKKSTYGGSTLGDHWNSRRAYAPEKFWSKKNLISLLSKTIVCGHLNMPIVFYCLENYFAI